MISRKCFERQWVLKQASEIGCRNPVMLEKTIVALQLLGHLAESGLPIQFKGGTSLLLRLNPIRRLVAVDPAQRRNAQAFHYWYQAQRILTGGSMPEESAK